MVFCMAFGCSNKNDAYERGVSFHRLPLNQAALLEQWLVSMRLENPHVTQHARVCSDHFSPGCYLPDKKLDLGMGGKRKRLLKPNAVPTLFDFHKVTKMNSRSTKRIRIEVSVEIRCFHARMLMWTVIKRKQMWTAKCL